MPEKQLIRFEGLTPEQLNVIKNAEQFVGWLPSLDACLTLKGAKGLEEVVDSDSYEGANLLSIIDFTAE